MAQLLNNTQNKPQIGNNFGTERSIQRPNKWLNDKKTHDNKQTDDEKQSIHSEPITKRRYDEEKAKQLWVEFTTAVSNKELDKIVGFETSHRIPIRSYMWDILTSLRSNNGVISQNIDEYIKWLPCAGGIFQNYFRYGSDMNPFTKHHKQTKSQQIKSLLNCVKHEYRDDLSPIVLPNELSFKIDGIWEVDIRIFRAINLVLQKMEFFDIKCQIHISIWSNGAQKQSEFTQDNNDDDIDSMDDVIYDPLYDSEDINQEILNINNDCSNIDIDDLIHLIDHIKVDREEIDVKTDDIDDISCKYEKIQVFITKIMQGPAVPKCGDAVMILFDTRKAPKLVAYIWRERLNDDMNDEGDINIGDDRIKSKQNKKRRYFELYAGRNTQNKVNVGQYVGMDIFMHSHDCVHQFWTIFNTEIRFEQSHATELWRHYYKNETVFEVAADFDAKYDEYQQYKDNDINKRKLYQRYYGKMFIDKLNDKTAIFQEKQLLKEKEQLYGCLDDKIPELDKYKPFQFHWKRAQYAKFYGSDFIRRLNDKTAKFNHAQLLEKKEQDRSNKKAPDLEEYGPFRFHWKRAAIVNDLEHDFDVNRIKDLNPVNFKQLKEDATTEDDGWEDTK